MFLTDTQWAKMEPHCLWHGQWLYTAQNRQMHLHDTLEAIKVCELDARFAKLLDKRFATLI
jgi:hypothetical protein